MTTIHDLPTPSNDALKRSKALEEHIREVINHDGGFISFAKFMELALYTPQLGYYHAETFTLGKQGDFTTAPEISPLFAQCFAKQLLPIFDALGKSHVLELGAGTGHFAYDFLSYLKAQGALPEQYYIYDVSFALRKKQQDFIRTMDPDLLSHITWLETLPTQFEGVMIANEVLDALPVHCFRIEDEGIKERSVAWEKDKLIWHLNEPGMASLNEKVMHLRECYDLYPGYQSEINLGLSRFLHTLISALHRGILLFADYGYGQREYYHHARTQGTLTCFYQHRKHADPLILPGLQDITAHVDFTQVAEIAVGNDCSLLGFTSQAGFLLANGLIELAEREEKNKSPIPQFELHQAIKLLTLPTEMGDVIKVIALGKNMELSLKGFHLQDRRRDL